MTGLGTKRKSLPFYLKKGGLVLFFCGVATYAAFEARWLISGPILDLESPSDGQIFKTPLITVSGEASKISYIYLNDTKVYIDAKGKFSYRYLLMSGYNVITVKAFNRYGEEIIKKAEVFYKPSEPETAYQGNNIADRTQEEENFLNDSWGKQKNQRN